MLACAGWALDSRWPVPSRLLTCKPFHTKKRTMYAYTAQRSPGGWFKTCNRPCCGMARGALMQAGFVLQSSVDSRVAFDQSEFTISCAPLISCAALCGAICSYIKTLQASTQVNPAILVCFNFVFGPKRSCGHNGLCNYKEPRRAKDKQHWGVLNPELCPEMVRLDVRGGG